MTTDELIAMLVDSEWDDRHNRAIERAVRNARFRYKATLEALDYSAERGLDKNLLHRLADGEFIRKKENLLITGPTGTGKSFIASALGYQCCGLGFKVLYAGATRLFAWAQNRQSGWLSHQRTNENRMTRPADSG